MTRRITDTTAVRDFIDVAAQFKCLIQSRNRLTDVELLQQAYILLLQLCLHASQLPAIQRSESFKGDMTREQRHKQWNELFKSLGAKLAKYDYYLEIFDPYDSDKEAGNGSLADDLAEIYSDLVPGLEVWEKADANRRRDIVWDWCYAYDHHWGEHATNAIRPIYFLLYQRMDEDEYGWTPGERMRFKKSLDSK